MLLDLITCAVISNSNLDDKIQTVNQLIDSVQEVVNVFTGHRESSYYRPEANNQGYIEETNSPQFDDMYIEEEPSE